MATDSHNNWINSRVSARLVDDFDKRFFQVAKQWDAEFSETGICEDGVCGSRRLQFVGSAGNNLAAVAAHGVEYFLAELEPGHLAFVGDVHNAMVLATSKHEQGFREICGEGWFAGLVVHEGELWIVVSGSHDRFDHVCAVDAATYP